MVVMKLFWRRGQLRRLVDTEPWRAGNNNRDRELGIRE